MSRIAVVASLALAACVHHERAVSTTTTTAAPLRVLAVELRGTTECAYALPRAVAFDTEDDLDDEATQAIDKWAVCVGSPRNAGTTVEVGGPDEAAFSRRAERIRELLARRGVDPHRVEIRPGTAGRGAIALGLFPLDVAPDARVRVVK